MSTPTRSEKKEENVWKTSQQASTQQVQGQKKQTHPPTRPKQTGQVHQPTDSGQVLTYCSTTAPT